MLEKFRPLKNKSFMTPGNVNRGNTCHIKTSRNVILNICPRNDSIILSGTAGDVFSTAVCFYESLLICDDASPVLMTKEIAI